MIELPDKSGRVELSVFLGLKGKPFQLSSLVEAKGAQVFRKDSNIWHYTAGNFLEKWIGEKLQRSKLKIS